MPSPLLWWVSPCLLPPSWLPEARQYFTHFAVSGIDTGASTVETPRAADTFECLGTGPWKHYVNVNVGVHRVPAVRLELRLATELVRDRPERVARLLEHLQHHGADLGLLERCLHDRELSPELQDMVLTQLGRSDP